jgi:hypothetical protein
MMHRGLSSLLLALALWASPAQAAVELLGAGNDRIDAGNVTYDGRHALTVALTFKPDSNPGAGTNLRLASHFSGTANQQAWLVYIPTGLDEVSFAVATGAGTYWQYRTSALNMTAGTTYRMVFRFKGDSYAASTTIKIAVNGVDQALTSVSTTGMSVFNQPGTSAIQIGHETGETIDGEDGDYSEFALWVRYLSDAIALDIASGRNPGCYPQDGVVYLPLTTASDLTDKFSGITASQTGAADATHPSMTSCGGATDPPPVH